jgi:hypothetical protein
MAAELSLPSEFVRTLVLEGATLAEIRTTSTRDGFDGPEATPDNVIHLADRRQSAGSRVERAQSWHPLDSEALL